MPRSYQLNFSQGRWKWDIPHCRRGSKSLSSRRFRCLESILRQNRYCAPTRLPLCVKSLTNISLVRRRCKPNGVKVTNFILYLSDYRIMDVPPYFQPQDPEAILLCKRQWCLLCGIPWRAHLQGSRCIMNHMRLETI